MRFILTLQRNRASLDDKTVNYFLRASIFKKEEERLEHRSN